MKCAVSLVMMRLYGALILFIILSTACGLKCYSCVTAKDPTIYCTRTISCPELLDNCFSFNKTGVITKGCRRGLNCLKYMNCCEEDLCNSAVVSGSSAVLLLLSSAITTLFL